MRRSFPAVLVAGMLAACAGFDLEPPVLQVIWRNHTSEPVATELSTRAPESDSSAGGTVVPCDVGGGGTDLADDMSWELTVEGEVVLDSSHRLPSAHDGEMVEIIVDIYPEGAKVEAISVRRALDGSAWAQHFESLREEMACQQAG